VLVCLCVFVLQEHGVQLIACLSVNREAALFAAPVVVHICPDPLCCCHCSAHCVPYKIWLMNEWTTTCVRMTETMPPPPRCSFTLLVGFMLHL
jgi:hypothetical protein